MFVFRLLSFNSSALADRIAPASLRFGDLLAHSLEQKLLILLSAKKHGRPQKQRGEPASSHWNVSLSERWPHETTRSVNQSQRAPAPTPRKKRSLNFRGSRRPIELLASALIDALERSPAQEPFSSRCLLIRVSMDRRTFWNVSGFSNGLVRIRFAMMGRWVVPVGCLYCMRKRMCCQAPASDDRWLCQMFPFICTKRPPKQKPQGREPKGL